MKIMFAEAVVITKALSDYKDRWECNHEQHLDEADEQGRTWVFIEDKLDEDEANEYKALKKLIGKFTSAELRGGQRNDERRLHHRIHRMYA